MTAYELGITDWSSDVCSSDLVLCSWQPQCPVIDFFEDIAGPVQGGVNYTASVTLLLGAGDAVGLLRVRQVGVVPVLAMPEVVRAEVIEVRAIKHLGLVGVTGVLIAMIHANQNYLLESEVIGHLQRRIGHCPAFMHSHAYVVTEAAGRTGRVDLISKIGRAHV